METAKKNELVLIDPKEYGLDEKQASDVQNGFLPIIAERDSLAELYSAIVKSEITHDVCLEARELRLKLVKVRTSSEKTGKSLKEFYLAGGRFVDAWRNKNKVVIEQMEEKLDSIENHFINIEKEKIKKLESERISLLLPFQDASLNPGELGNMPETVWNAYFESVKVAHSNKIEAEKQAELKQIAEQKAEAERIEAQRIENEKLKAEAEKKEKEFAAERAKLEKQRKEAEEKAAAERKLIEEKAEKERKEIEAIRNKRNSELTPFIVFIKDYNKLLSLPEKEYQKEFSDIKKGAELQWELEKAEKIKADAEAEKQAKILQEIKKKEKAELDAKLKEEQEIEAKSKAPDKEKLIELAETISKLQFPNVNSESAKLILQDTRGLLNKIEVYIKTKSETI